MITQFAINQAFVYPVNQTGKSGDRIRLWLGPSVGIFFFGNEPDIAVDGFDYSQSFAALFSAGTELIAIYPIRNKFLIESRLSTSLLSLGFRMVDNEEEDQSPVRLLSVFSGLNAFFEAGIRYRMLYRISAGLSYRFEVCRINKWDPMISASDNLVVSLQFIF
jgi:hypothetical protein